KVKLGDHCGSGAIVAAAGSWVPEVIGGERNWDYRYSWIRDASFAVYALNRIGCPEEAAGFLGWALDAVERGGLPRALYDLDGSWTPREWNDAELDGYRGSRPGGGGDGAAEQLPHDGYCESLDFPF